MNEHQRQIASEAIARIVAEALESSEKPSGADLVELAENAATAIAAGFAKLLPHDAGTSLVAFDGDLFSLMCDWCEPAQNEVSPTLPLDEREKIRLAAQVRRTCCEELKEVLRRHERAFLVPPKGPAA